MKEPAIVRIPVEERRERLSLEATERVISVEEATADFPDRVRTHDHHEFYWFPHTDVALTKTQRRVPAQTLPRGPGRVRRFVDDEILSNGVFAAVCALDARFPSLTTSLASATGAVLSGREYTDASASVFVSQRRVRFREMEYALPITQIPDALDQIRALVRRRGWRISFPLEVRAAAADDLMLSTASGRDTGYIAVHRYHRDPPDDYFATVEKVLARRGGRPHWGKMHTRDIDDVRAMYPRFDEFRTLRDRFDPERLFANGYLNRVLGR